MKTFSRNAKILACQRYFRPHVLGRDIPGCNSTPIVFWQLMFRHYSKGRIVRRIDHPAVDQILKVEEPTKYK